MKKVMLFFVLLGINLFVWPSMAVAEESVGELVIQLSSTWGGRIVLVGGAIAWGIVFWLIWGRWKKKKK